MSVIDCERRSEKSLADPLRKCLGGQVENGLGESVKAGHPARGSAFPKAAVRGVHSQFRGTSANLTLSEGAAEGGAGCLNMVASDSSADCRIGGNDHATDVT